MSEKGGTWQCAVQEALDHYISLIDSLEHVEDGSSLVDPAKTLLKQCYVSKCIACLVHFFENEKGLDALRDRVHAELSNMRAHGVHEKDYFPTALKQRVSLALAKRKA
eukprot:6492147-Amphidinium_carterae.2